MGRKIISILLLAFVVGAVAVALTRRAQAEPVPPPAQAAAEPAPALRIVAFYFHGTKRCTSCNAIESQTVEALQADIAAQAIDFRSINVDEAAHRHYVDDFALVTRTVVLAEEAGGQVRRWKRLDSCWDLFDDPAQFAAYIRCSLAEFRAAKS